ncbi:MAG: B12-binding domain-containing radical SAM protein, partial [Planctomycetaceae bacterium]
MLLIHPPVTKPCEPPAGIARLLGALRKHGIKSGALDMSLEAPLNLVHGVREPADTWTRRAIRNLPRHLASLRNDSGYRHFPRYQRAVLDLNRLFQAAGRARGVNLRLANCQYRGLSPVKSLDLARAAENPEADPFFPYFSRRIRRVLEAGSFGTVGFSLNYLNQAVSTFAMAGFLRKNIPSLKIALGGGLVTSWVRRPGWQNPFAGLVDFLVAGPGEAPLLSFLGVAALPERINSLPDYDDFPAAAYLSPGWVLPYSASSGCYWHQCLFCPERAEGNPYQPSSPHGVIQDLRLLAEKRKPVLIHLLDNALSPGLLRELAGHELGLPWYGFARITESLADLDFCLALRKSGCVMLQLGLESGDQGVLERLQKGIDLRVASRVLKTLKKAGIAAYVYLLFGTPAESETEARRTLDFTVAHSGEIGFLNLAIFNLPAHGEEARKLATREFYEGDLSLYSSFSHPRGWNRDAVRSFLEKEFKKHPSLAAILQRDPPI